jgi:2-polyprenyl-3-methyl-5-hydroxy-6-metoxy-1,4-benzoquinol methylase
MNGDQEREFPHWEQLYEQQNVESMPWFNAELDKDVEDAIEKLRVGSGYVLDIGTGPGTQAVQLARRGFDVTATDISAAAIRLANDKWKGETINVTWKQDDILQTGLDKQFDIVLDRGCFHVLPPNRRKDYLDVVAGLLRRDGYLFLKCFSRLQPGEQGPYRFTRQQIEELFSPQFRIHSIRDTVYQGTLDPLPRALFGILQRV